MASLQTDIGCLYLAVCDKPWVDCSLRSKSTTPPSDRVLISGYSSNFDSQDNFILQFGLAVSGNRYSEGQNINSWILE